MDWGGPPTKRWPGTASMKLDMIRRGSDHHSLDSLDPRLRLSKSGDEVGETGTWSRDSRNVW